MGPFIGLQNNLSLLTIKKSNEDLLNGVVNVVTHHNLQSSSCLYVVIHHM